jgi:hypothetical protein
MRIRTFLACPIVLAVLASGCNEAPATPAPATPPASTTPDPAAGAPKKPAAAKKHKATPGGVAPDPTNIPDK